MSKRANGEGSVFKQPNGKWRAEITLGWDIAKQDDGTTKRRRIVKTKSGFKLKRDALQWLREFHADDEPIKNATFKALYDAWSGPHYEKVSNDTSNGYKAAYRNCEPLWHRQFTQIKAADLQSVVDNAKTLNGRPMSRRSKLDIKYLISILYRYAMQNDYCHKDYSKFIKLPKKEKSKRDAFTPDELELLWQEHRNGGDFAQHILAMCYTGMRYGEYSRVTKDMVNLDERTITGAGIKTEAGRERVIPIAESIYDIIKGLYGSANNKLLTMHEKVFYNSFRATLQKLGIRPLTPHCCRHTFATLMATAGIQPAIITATTGHEKYLTTLQYTHISHDEKLKAVDALFVPSSNAE